MGTLALAMALGGCSSPLFSSDRVDYRTAATKMNPLEVPPDLQQLSREGRYPQQRGTISASTAAPAGAGSVRTSAPAVAPTAIGEFRIEKDGNRRWLSVPLPPEQLWPQLSGFWRDMGFTLAKNDAAAGVMETNWAENRAKLPQDVIRKSLGAVLDTLYSTGELDQYRTRVERSANGGSEIIITHRGMVEVYTNTQKDFTKWEPRPSEPELESEMLSRLLVKLGASEAAARDALAAPALTPSTPTPPRARVVAGKPATLEVDDGSVHHFVSMRFTVSTTAWIVPGAASASRSTARASASRIATALRACTSCATSTRPPQARKSLPASSPSCSAPRPTPARRRSSTRSRYAPRGQKHWCRCSTRRASQWPARTASASWRCWPKS